MEGFRLQDREFRIAPEDEAKLSLDVVQARLARDFVVGAFSGDVLMGIAGLTRFAGVKVEHKTLLWGMYLKADFRGSGAADMLMSAMIDQAHSEAEVITLTVVDENRRAVRFYERWGFWKYGVEPASVKLADGSYLDEALMIRRFQ